MFATSSAHLRSGRLSFDRMGQSQSLTPRLLCTRFHFDSIAHDNSASSSSVLSVFPLPNASSSTSATTSSSDASAAPVVRGGPLPAPLCLVGEQTLIKYGRATGSPEVIRVWLAVFRLAPAANIDVVLSVNEPLAESAIRGTRGLESSKAKGVFEEAVRTLEVRDWGLFAE